MSENKEPKVKNPKFYEIIDGAVPFCPNCGTKFVEPVAANYDYICPACEISIFDIIFQSFFPSSGQVMMMWGWRCGGREKQSYCIILMEIMNY